MEKNSSKLPPGWAEIEFFRIVKTIPLTGKKLKQKEYLQRGKLPVIDQGKEFVGGYTNKIDLKVDCILPVIVFGDHTKVVKYVNKDFVAGADGVKVLDSLGALIPKLLYYFIQSISLPNKGYARHYQFLEKSMIRIPPLNEQKRIVAKIDDLLDEIKRIQETLNKISLLIQQLRNAILLSIFSEESTYNWTKSYVGKIVKIQNGYAFKSNWFSNNGIRLIRNVNVGHGKIVWDETVHLTKKMAIDFKKFILSTGDILISLDRPIISTGLKIARLTERDVPSLLLQRVGRVQFSNDDVIPDFFYIWLNSPLFISAIKPGRSLGVPHISAKEIESIPFSYPDLTLQKEIIATSKKSFLFIEESERSLLNISKQINKLTNTILKKSFEGKLVPQDPNDEPAEILLEKIKQEKQKSPSKISTRKKRK